MKQFYLQIVCWFKGGHEWSQSHGWYDEPERGAYCLRCKTEAFK